MKNQFPTEWYNLVVRNKAAEICEKHLSKGDKIYIGKCIKSRQWQTEMGPQNILVKFK
jgi:single-strand DNA-binding protein